MSDEAAAGEKLQAPEMPINIMAQYIRDLSFENPNAPESLRGGETPQMDINIGMDARKLPDDAPVNLYEVVLNLRAIAIRENTPVFIAELQYAALVTLNGIPEDTHHPVLLIEIPRLIFPYARQILSDLTMHGGYPPLMLNPVDFQALYVERFKNEIEASRRTAEEGTTKAEEA
jgi:preprotein translocase subunit SecB